MAVLNSVSYSAGIVTIARFFCCAVCLSAPQPGLRFQQIFLEHWGLADEFNIEERRIVRKNGREREAYRRKHQQQQQQGQPLASTREADLRFSHQGYQQKQQEGLGHIHSLPNDPVIGRGGGMGAQPEAYLPPGQLPCYQPPPVHQQQQQQEAVYGGGVGSHGLAEATAGQRPPQRLLDQLRDNILRMMSRDPKGEVDLSKAGETRQALPNDLLPYKQVGRVGGCLISAKKCSLVQTLGWDTCCWGLYWTCSFCVTL